MIIKGGARAKQNELSKHLLRADTNETVRVFDLHGVVARDLKGSLAEMAAIAAGSRSTKFLYHASINPGASTILTDAQWRQAVAELEKALGLEGHQRAVVLHTKNDRQHAHVVWNRVDVEMLKAAHHGHNYRTHETVARALERAFGLEHVQGVHVDRVAERPKRRATTRESQQEARTGWSRDQAVRDITAAWQASENGAAFSAALAEAGYCLARGDRKDLVILDPTGGVHGVARRIDGVRAADVRERLADLDPQSLPSLAEAREALCRVDHRKTQEVGKASVRGGPSRQWSATPTFSTGRQTLPPPQRYTIIKQVEAPSPARPTSKRQDIDQSPPSRSAPAPSPKMPGPSGPPRQRHLPLVPVDAALPPPTVPEHEIARAEQQERQARAASAEVANLARFHSEQMTKLDAHHEQRLFDLVRHVESEIVRHNGLIARFGNLIDKRNYHRELAFLVAKRHGIQQREIARQARVRDELRAAQQKERDEAAQRRAVRERLERDALERRLADQRTQHGRDQKERPGLEGPGG